MLCAVLLSFSAEASIPLTKDNKNSRPLPEFIKPSRKKPSKERKNNPNAESSFSYTGSFHPDLAAWIEYFEDDRRRIEYLKHQNYITASTKWRIYADERFGAYVEYPDIFTKGLEKPAGAEGLWLQSHDGYVKLTVLTGYNTAGKSAQGILNEIAADAENAKIIAKKYGNGWYRLVYRRLEDTVHRYGIAGDYMKAEFILGYPNEKSEQFKSVTERMEQTLNIKE